MSNTIDIERILKTNPEIDADLLEEASNLIKELRRMGIKNRGYQLERTRFRVDDELEHDPRTVRLVSKK